MNARINGTLLMVILVFVLSLIASTFIGYKSTTSGSSIFAQALTRYCCTDRGTCTLLKPIAVGAPCICGRVNGEGC
jgi:hypothetical protein